MKTKILQSINLIRCVSGVNINLSRYAAMVIMLLMLGGEEMWASSYYTAFTATSSDTGKGLVYASGPGTSTAPANDEAYEASKGIGQSGDTGGSNKTNTYYAWAKAARGYAFDGWTTSASDGSSAVSGGCSTSQSGTASGAAFTVKSSVADKTVTGTATAKWKNDPNPYVVTFGVPVDGSYTMTYSYTVVKDGKFATEEKPYSMSESSTAASGQITSYAGDNVTVSTDATNFEGWYDNAGFIGKALSTSSSYSFQVSGATSIYAKFKPATKYYGKVAASIPAVPNSMPGGGTIYISDIAGTTGAAFSEESQEAKITTFNSDATPPASMNQTFYLHARPNDRRYTFRGWFDNEAGTGTALSTNEDWEYTFAVSSHTEASPTTKTVYAIFDFKLYYMQVEIEPAIQGQGMVLASETKLTNPEYGLFSSESSVLTYALRAGASGTNDVYVYAKPKYGYKLAGWYSDPECTIAASVASDGKYTATGSSIYPMDPTIIKLYAKFVEESKINVTYNNPDHKKGEYKAYALDIAEINDEYVWSQVEIFSSIGKSANTVQSQYKTDVLILSAEAISGYGVTSWTDGSTTKTTPSQIYNTTATAAKTVGVTFGDAKPFMVKASGTYYSSFSEALAAVGNSGQITVVQNAYIPAGNYTIPSGVTLLVPFDDAYTLRTTDPTHAYAAPGTPSVYVKLTLGANAHLTVGGSISVSSTSQGNQPYGGCVYGKYGQIDMESGSTITLNSGANLYCWGYITGKGEITAKSGSKVYEDFQIACWRGGSAAWSISGNSQKVFPLAQYYIQNIEAKLRVESGATEYVWTSVSASNKAQRPDNPITLIGESSGLFRIASGSLTKWFDAVNDRQMYEIEGNTALGAVSMHVYITITSTDYVLPLTNNMDITIKSGTLSCSNDVAILPGASIRIDEGAKASITGNIFIYDKAEWPADGASAFNYNNVSFKKVNYTATPITNARTYANMKDAILDVNGTFETNGKFYTTAGGADICSSKGTGVVKFTGTAGTASATYQATQSGTSISYTTIPVTAARLHNSDDSYTLTAGSVSGDKYIYNKNLGQWMKNPKTITWDANGGVSELTTTAYSEGSFLGELPAATKDGYDLVGWFTSANGGTEISASTKVTATTTYYAHWTQKTYTITYKNQGESTFSGSTHIDTPNPHPTTHTFGTATTLNGATREHYTFGGWYKTVSCTGTVVTEIPASTSKNITLYAKWTINSHTLTWNLGGGSTTSTTHTTGSVAYGTIINYPEASTMTRENYVFNGWSTSVTAMPDANLTITAQWTPAVASVTANNVTTYHTTIAEAFTTANSKTNAIVTMLQDATTSQIEITKAMTIDLNGKTISSTQAARVGVFKINASGKTVTITGSGLEGKIDHTATVNDHMYGIWLTAGSLNIEGGTIYVKNNAAADNSYRAYGIWTDGGSSITMSNGKIEATSKNMSFGIYAGNACDITMTGGTITSSGNSFIRGIYTQGKTELTNATITVTAADASSNCCVFYAKQGALTINGGTYMASGAGSSYVFTMPNESQVGSITIKGGLFNGATKEVDKAGSYGTVSISGGYYAHNTDLAGYCTANHYVFDLTAAEKAEVGNDYNYKVAEAYTITFKDGDDKTIQSGLVEKGQTPAYTGETPAKTATAQYTYTFNNTWSPALAPVEEGAQTYTAQFDSTVNKYTVTFKNGDDVLQSTEWEYGATPSYDGATPVSPEDDEKYTHPFTGWSPEISEVTANREYTAVYGDAITKMYPVVWKDWNGTILDDTTKGWGWPIPEYKGSTPTRETAHGMKYTFAGWKQLESEVEHGDVTFKARYSAETVENATPEEVINVAADEEVDVVTMTVPTGTSLEIADGGSVEADVFIIQATTEDQGSPGAQEEVLVSGELSETGSKNVSAIYYDLTRKGGTEPFLARVWYAVAVPWAVEVPNYANGGVFIKRGENFVPQRLGATFDLISYDGNCRAQNGAGANCWVYLEDEIVDAENKRVMVPGKLYMIYLTEETSTIRFKKADDDSPIHTNSLTVSAHNETSNANDANWNGIANPATYRAYMNVNVSANGLVQKFVPGAQPRDGGRYLTTTLDDKQAVGQPFFVQVDPSVGIEASVVVTRTNSSSAPAPRRAQVSEDKEARYAIGIAANGKLADRLYIQTAEEKEDKYVIGKDMAKMGISNYVAQIWVARYDAKLCQNTVAMARDKAVYPLGIYAPQAGEYMIFAPTDMEPGDNIYLTKDGRVIWNLTMAPYYAALEQGTTTNYGLRLIRSNAPAVTTGVDEVQSENAQCTKVIMDDHVYILRGEELYTITGQKAK